VRQWEAPHSHDNYLLKEMGYRLARERADILRPLAMLSAFVLPAVLILVALFLPQVGAIVLAALAVASVCAGLAIERWLFFAEAKHAVTLYYEGGDPVRV
jgi:DMSO reductase anchor subunit